MNTNRNILSNVKFRDLVRWWLTFTLMLLPFQQKIIRSDIIQNDMMLYFVRFIDEIAIIIFFPLALIKIYKNNKKSDRLSIILLLPLIFMGTVAIISGMINGNSLIISVLGSFDYIKNFLVIFIFAAFFREYREFKILFRIVLTVAVCIGIVAFIQEAWAVVSRYILQKGIYDPGIYIFRDMPRLTEQSWRLGISRTASLMYSPNLLGLYSLLIICIYLNIEKKVNFLFFTSLVTGVVVSVSRMVYAGFTVLVVTQLFKGRKYFLFFVIPGVFLLIQMSMLKEDFNILNIVPMDKISTNMSLEDNESYLINNEKVFRKYARNKALEVWKDNPFWGVGPGMFGGTISVKYNSYFYEEYNFNTIAYLEYVKGIDQYWPQLLAETGIIGTAAFAGIIISLFVTLYLLRQGKITYEEKGVFTGLMVYTVVLIIYAFGSGLNLSAILFTYSAFLGIGLTFKNISLHESAC